MADNQQQQVRNKLLDMVNMRYLSQAICIASHRRISDIVTSAEAVNISEVAAKLDCHEINLYRLMSFLAANGIFFEKEGRNFIGNELSEVMRESVDEGCFHKVEVIGSKAVFNSVLNLECVLNKNSEMTPFEVANGEPFYTYLSHHPEERNHFDKAFVCHKSDSLPKVPEAYDFSKFKTVCDLAGGTGSLLKDIMTKYPHINGVLFEMEGVIQNALPELSTDEAFKNRFTAVGGDLFTKITPTADIYTISMTLHCMLESKFAITVKNIKDAMRRTTGCRLLIFEKDVDQTMVPNEMSTDHMNDILMMCQSGGRQRTLSAWKHQLSAHGLKVLGKVQVTDTFMGVECELEN